MVVVSLPVDYMAWKRSIGCPACDTALSCSVGYIRYTITIKANSHRQTRHNSTVELRLGGFESATVGGSLGHSATMRSCSHCPTPTRRKQLGRRVGRCKLSITRRSTYRALFVQYWNKMPKVWTNSAVLQLEDGGPVPCMLCTHRSCTLKDRSCRTNWSDLISYHFIYSLRPRRHDVALSRGAHCIYDCNFIVRQYSSTAILITCHNFWSCVLWAFSLKWYCIVL